MLDRVYGGDQAYFRAVSPLRLAEQNAGRLDDSLIRMVIGDEDETLPANIRFREHLERLGIAHRWTLLPGVGHNPMAVIRTLGDTHWAFYREAFAAAR
jgi:enterochelin esterase-like enzyme